MPSRAILVGNIQYKTLPTLACCHDDLAAIQQLLVATEKYDLIDVIENVDADTLKDRIRLAADQQPTTELFFYFTGHGYQKDAEFFLCATNFDVRTPHQTGLSTTELHNLLRMSQADVVVKVIDACHSGTLLLKDAFSLAQQSKDGFKSLIQMASCLDSQQALTGDPISMFTAAFRAAALRRDTGVVFYSDIIEALRDAFIDNHTQTPHFISQGTGREQFVEDAARLNDLRAKLSPPPRPPVAPPTPPTPELSLLERLQEAESKVVTPDKMKSFVDGVFDGLKAKFGGAEFDELFDTNFVEHSNYDEPTTRGFIIRCLAKEARPDNFVTAEVTRERQRKSYWERMLNPLPSLMDDEDYVERFELELNCKMERAQLKITLKPKFLSLKQMAVVVSCAPSLTNCYVFEFATQHALRDIGTYDTEGAQLYRNWYVRAWDDKPQDLVDKIVKNLGKAVESYIASTSKRMSE